MKAISKFNPDRIKAQCNEILVKLEQDNNAIDNLVGAVNLLFKDDEFSGSGFDSIKERAEDYFLVLKAMKTANEQDMEDARLMINLSNCAQGMLDGQVIVKHKAAAYREYKSDLEKASECSSTEYLKEEYISSYYTLMAKYYKVMAEHDAKEYNFWKEKENLYYQIDTGSAYLFEAGKDIRPVIGTALEQLGGLSLKADYSKGLSEEVKELLQHYCDDYAGSFDTGHLSEAEKVQIRNWLVRGVIMSDMDRTIAIKMLEKYFIKGSLQERLSKATTEHEIRIIKNMMSLEEYSEFRLMKTLQIRMA